MERRRGKPHWNLRFLRDGFVVENADGNRFLYFHRVSTEFAESLPSTLYLVLSRFEFEVASFEG